MAQLVETITSENFPKLLREHNRMHFDIFLFVKTRSLL
jgi:hypothetical protein